MSDLTRALVDAAVEEITLSASLEASNGRSPTYKALGPSAVARVLDMLADEHVRFTPEALRRLAVEVREENRP